MGCITKSVGRLLFVTFLVSSAYLHISKPETFTTTLTTNWNQLSECVGKHLPGVLPSLENVSSFYDTVQLELVDSDLWSFWRACCLVDPIWRLAWGSFIVLDSLRARNVQLLLNLQFHVVGSLKTTWSILIL